MHAITYKHNDVRVWDQVVRSVAGQPWRLVVTGTNTCVDKGATKVRGIRAGGGGGATLKGTWAVESCGGARLQTTSPRQWVQWQPGQLSADKGR